MSPEAKPSQGKSSIGELHQTIDWMYNILKTERRPFNTVIQNGPNLPGWVVDIGPVLEHDLVENVRPTMIPIAPDNGLFPFGDAHAAKKLVKQWEKDLEGPIIPFVVRGGTEENPWLVQPVKINWLRLSEQTLLTMYEEAKDTKNELPLRAAVMVRTGRKPEDIKKK